MPDILLTISSHVGRGGIGAGAWAARVTGPSNQHRLAFTFCDQEDHTRHRKSGRIDIFLTVPGVYELRGVGGFAGTEGEAFSGFIKVAADGTYKILGGREMAPKAVLAEVAAPIEVPLSQLGDVIIAEGLRHAKASRPKNLPYPWCYQPDVCQHLGSCPKDPNCGD